MKTKILITLLLLSPIVYFAFAVYYPPSKTMSKRELKRIYKEYSIASEKDASFSNKVERVFIISRVESPLIPVFSHSFEHSLISALESNGVEASVMMVEDSELIKGVADYSKEVEAFAPDATMHISVKPIYYPGYQAINGTDFDVSLIDTATGKRVWQATGKVDYVRPKYRKSGGNKKEHAFHATEAIVSAFAAEVNDQKPARIHRNIGARKRAGQRVD